MTHFIHNAYRSLQTALDSFAVRVGLAVLAFGVAPCVILSMVQDALTK